jgi:LacI family transcriptional regulator
VLDTLVNRQVDGLIISPPANAGPQILALEQLNIPFVLVDRLFPDIKTNYVVLNNHAASYTATRHLAEAGCKNIGMVTYTSTLFHLEERKKGYLDALKELKLPSKKSWISEVDIANKEEEIVKAIKELLHQPERVDGVLFASNMLAAHGLRYINGLSLKVPDDLAIVSFDETAALDLFYAPITYMRQPLSEMAKLATSILMDNINAKNKITQVEMDAELIVRDSSIRRKNVDG